MPLAWVLSGPGALPSSSAPQMPSRHSDEAGKDWLQEACRTLVSWAAEGGGHCKQSQATHTVSKVEVESPAAPLLVMLSKW